VQGWEARGLARPWTDTFHVATGDGPEGVVTGPMRYAAPGGLRSLVEDLAAALPALVHPRDVEAVVRTDAGASVDGDAFDAVVLAMPGPQAGDLLADGDPAHAAIGELRYDPVLTLVAAYDERCWHELDGVFVNDSAMLRFVADDGRRRGDDAPVLVAHSGSVVAAAHLDDPASAAPMLLDALAHAVGATAKPAWFDVRRWSLAKPRNQADAAYWFDGTIGVCGDAWGSESRIETAWTSGNALGRVVAAELGARR
jgi:predicted NAD/FAD-dependent oxidoreductase